MDRKRNGKIRVLIADDHTATREGIHALLQAVPDLEVIGEAQSGTEAQQMAVELCPDILLFTGAQFARSRRWSQEVGARWGCLTTREQEVLIHLAHGKSNAEIAEALSIGVRTVDTHIEHILEKLDVASSREAIAWVWKHELLDGEEVST